MTKKIGPIQADVLTTIRDYPDWRPWSYERRMAVARLKERGLIAARVSSSDLSTTVGYALTAGGITALKEYEEGRKEQESEAEGNADSSG